MRNITTLWASKLNILEDKEQEEEKVVDTKKKKGGAAVNGQ